MATEKAYISLQIHGIGRMEKATIIDQSFDQDSLFMHHTLAPFTSTDKKKKKENKIKITRATKLL